MKHDLTNYLETLIAQHGVDETMRKSIGPQTVMTQEMNLTVIDSDLNTMVVDPAIHTEHPTTHQKFGLKPSAISLNNAQDQNDKTETPILSEFELLKVLGKGGMGIVYEGLQKSLNRLVAIKKSKADIRFLAQIYHEAQITAFLEHPHILTVHDFGIDQDGFPIQVMKKIDGITWSTLLYDHQHPFWQELDIEQHDDSQLLFHLDVLSKVAQAIGYAHQKKIIHRDLKPENVMIGKFGEVFVLDWGIALYLGPQEDLFIAQKFAGLKDAMVGTPGYMAPEQVNLEIPPSPATDVYLLAAILYEITHKQLLHQGKQLNEILINIKDNQIPNFAKTLNQELKNLLLFSLKTNPTQRPANAQVFRKLLQQVIYAFKSRQLEIKGFTALDALKKLISLEQQPLTTMQMSLMVLSLDEQKKENEMDDAFDLAKHYFKSSLEFFEHNEESKRGLQELLSLWIKRCIKKQDFRQAKRYLKELPINQYHFLEIAIQEAQKKLENEKKEIKELKKWQESQSIQKSEKPRVYFALFCLIFLGFGSLSLYFLSIQGKYHDSAKGRFYVALILTSLAVIFSEGWFYFKAKKEQLNQAFQSFKYLIYTVFISVTLARFLGWQFHNQSELILLHEMPLVAFASFATVILMKKKDFLIGGIAFTILGIFAVLYPSQILLFYALAQFILWLSVSLIWWMALKKN
jgi:serine/threonine protein kinase